MQTEQIKESIKLKTEFLKAYFIVIIGLITGLCTLVLKEKLSIFQEVLIGLGVLATLVFLILLFKTNKDIKKLISQLK